MKLILVNDWAHKCHGCLRRNDMFIEASCRIIQLFWNTNYNSSVRNMRGGKNPIYFRYSITKPDTFFQVAAATTCANNLLKNNHNNN